MMEANGLTVVKEKRYFPVAPVFSFFPLRFKGKALNFFHDKLKFISDHGPEVILFLQKNSMT
jgi:hypothetical protein